MTFFNFTTFLLQHIYKPFKNASLKYLQITKIQTMNAFIYILEGKVYKKVRN